MPITVETYTDAQVRVEVVEASGPAGPPGPPGDTGPAGPPGPPGADSVVPGPMGPEGPDGPAGPPGADGDDGAPGAPGVDGADGADGAPGADGADGADGPSAYEVAVTNGFVGTEVEWLASLEGEPGPTTPSGPAGGVLAGEYPNPELAPGQITGEHVDPTPAILIPLSALDIPSDASAITPSLRRLGTSPTDAARGDDPRFSTVGAQPGDSLKPPKTVGSWSFRPFGRFSNTATADTYQQNPVVSGETQLQRRNDYILIAQSAGKLQHFGGAIGQGAASNLNGVQYTGPMTLPACTITGICWDQIAAGSAGSVWIPYLYLADGGGASDVEWPGTLLWSGSVAADGANGHKSVTGLNLAHPGGRIWCGVVLQGQAAAAAKLRCVEGGVPIAWGAAAPLGLTPIGVYALSVTGALPDPFAVSGYLSQIPWMGLLVG